MDVRVSSMYGWIAMTMVCIVIHARPLHADVLSDEAGDSTTPWTVLEQRPGKGERCIVCDQHIHNTEIVEIRYHGRVFHVAQPMLDEFLTDPDLYFSELQARSALFDERSVSAQDMSWGWLIFGGYVLIGLIFGAICGYVAISRSLRPLPWFFAGLIGNVAALLVLTITPAGNRTALIGPIPKGLRKVPQTRSPVVCSHCGVTNHPAAQMCSGCNAALQPSVASEASQV